MVKQLLLVEDECAPDALEYFDSQLFKLTGLTLQDFFKNGERIEFGYSLCEYSLEYLSDEPYWRLYKKFNKRINDFIDRK
jgi:hypothetical protein